MVAQSKSFFFFLFFFDIIEKTHLDAILRQCDVARAMQIDV